ELYGLSNIEDILTDEDQDDSTLFSSIMSNDSINQYNEQFTKKFSTSTLQRHLEQKHGIRVGNIYKLKLQFDQFYPYNQID
ncbi:1379_t:CDS:2, partial [Racocetra fulgida]